jgi:hypothetical protein
MPDSLCSDSQWYPTPIPELEAFLRRGMTDANAVHNLYVLIKNVCYNLQLFEFLCQVQVDIKLSAVLEAEVRKNCIVTGSAIVEGILDYIVFASGQHRSEHWKELRTVKGNEFVLSGSERRRLDITVLKRLPAPIPKKEIRLRDLIQIAERHHLFGTDHTVYGRLQHLRKLRNKIHLYNSDAYGDHDYNIFNAHEFSETKDLLRHALTSTIFGWTGSDQTLFPYLF